MLLTGTLLSLALVCAQTLSFIYPAVSTAAAHVGSLDAAEPPGSGLAARVSLCFSWVSASFVEQPVTVTTELLAQSFDLHLFLAADANVHVGERRQG